MTESQTTDQPFIRKLTAIVLANMENEQFGVVEVSRQMGMTYSKINRKLKSINNQTLSRIIREIRLKRAMELLQRDEATVSEIAFRVGLAVQPTLISVFMIIMASHQVKLKKEKLAIRVMKNTFSFKILQISNKRNLYGKLLFFTSPGSCL